MLQGEVEKPQGKRQLLHGMAKPHIDGQAALDCSLTQLFRQAQRLLH